VDILVVVGAFTGALLGECLVHAILRHRRRAKARRSEFMGAGNGQVWVDWGRMERAACLSDACRDEDGTLYEVVRGPHEVTGEPAITVRRTGGPQCISVEGHVVRWVGKPFKVTCQMVEPVEPEQDKV